eukprot:TRINITY_DN26975_c0_g1_i1.p1 TRINITY_DN26975_c0_g1~~TRINITY_DN26975_c0_g1_i1.p1  ORF type:complete len:617 (+),score=202.54 TRINITY_DN26975_c0_g1_i1:25-1851(+)
MTSLNLCLRVSGGSDLPPIGTYSFRCELVDPEKMKKPFQKASWIVRRFIGNTPFLQGPNCNWDVFLDTPVIPNTLLRLEIVSKPGGRVFGETTFKYDELTTAEKPVSLQIEAASVMIIMSVQSAAPPEEKKLSKFGVGLKKLDSLVSLGISKASKVVEPRMQQVQAAIKGYVLSKETEESWDAITQLVYEEFRDVECSKLDFLMGLGLLSTYYQSNKQRTNDVILDEKFLKEAHYYSKFAVGAYGWKLREFEIMQKEKNLRVSGKGLATGFVEGDSENLSCLIGLTGLAVEDIIDHQWSSAEVFDPGHYVAVDHSTESIVVALRGTFHMRDLLIDLCGANEPLMDGLAHSGILRTALNKAAKLQPVVAGALERFPSYSVKITGHSLGAGTAALLTILWLRDNPKWKIQCWAFAPPCVTSQALSDQYKDTINSFVHNDDIIPRLCHGSIQALKNVILELLSQTENNVQRAFHLLNSGNSLGEQAARRISGFLQVQQNPEYHKIRAEATVEILVPPGTVYWSYKRAKVAKFPVIERSENHFFKEVVISPDMMFDHMPFMYENTLRALVENFEEIRREEQLHGKLPADVRGASADIEAEKIMSEKLAEPHM